MLPPKLATNGRGSSPATAKPALTTGGGAPCAPGQDRRQHGGAGSDRLGQHRVVARPALQRRGERRCLLRRERCNQLLGRGLVGLGKQDVEGDHRRALLAKRSQELRHRGARPGPLADRAERGFVDVDDPHRQRRVVALRVEALEGIEGDQPQRLKRERVGDPQRGRAGEHAGDQQHIHPARPEPHARAHPAVSQPARDRFKRGTQPFTASHE